MEKRRPRSYAFEFKTEAIALVSQGVKLIPEIASDLGIPKNTLYSWIAKSKRQGSFKEGPKQGDLDLAVENRRLQKELMIARMERDILKKATAFFAKESK